jgi:molecular chaperone GrpE
MRSAGLEVVNPLEEPFDPARHEAVGTELAETPELDGTVGRVYQVGYTFRGQLLRPARVVVRQYTLAD